MTAAVATDGQQHNFVSRNSQSLPVVESRATPLSATVNWPHCARPGRFVDGADLAELRRAGPRSIVGKAYQVLRRRVPSRILSEALDCAGERHRLIWRRLLAPTTDVVSCKESVSRRSCLQNLFQDLCGRRDLVCAIHGLGSGARLTQSLAEAWSALWAFKRPRATAHRMTCEVWLDFLSVLISLCVAVIGRRSKIPFENASILVLKD